MRKKRNQKQVFCQVLSWALIFSMVCPSISPLAAETIRAASNRPRYVDFARPSALTLAELGIATDSAAVRKASPSEEEPDHPSEDAALGGEEEETRVIPVTDDSLRQPEDLYEEVIEEPEGVLVQFDGGVRTYQTGDGEYTTVVGGYSGLYRSEDGSIRGRGVRCERGAGERRRRE